MDTETQQDKLNVLAGNDNITKEQLLKENENLTHIIKEYNFILNEYQSKYGNEIINQKNELMNKMDIQTDDIHFKKQLLGTFPIFKEYEIIISHLLDEKEKLIVDKKSLIQENYNLQSKIEELEKQNDEIYNALEERMKAKGNNMMYNRTFSKNENPKENNINNKNNINDINNSENDLKLFNTMKENYNNLLIKEKNEFKEKVDYENEINKLKIENDNMKMQLVNLKNKFKKEFEEMSKLETDINLKKQIIDRYNIDNKSLKGEIEEYKDAYNTLEARKNSEINNLLDELKDIRSKINDYKNNNTLLEEQNSKYKIENAQLNIDIKELKSDRDHLTKIIEDLNLTAQNITEKEKYMDSMIKSYKKKSDDLNLEKDKLYIKIKAKDNKINKMNIEYSNLLKEKINDYEILNNITKNNYEDIINIKENEIKELKANILSYKIEKDKYLYDYNLMKSEYDKLYILFNTENSNYIKKYEEAQNKLNNISNEYSNAIIDLKMKNENLENENQNMKKEINTFYEDKKVLEQKINNLEKIENELKKMNNDLKIKNNDYLQKNSECIKDMERLHAQYEIKLEKDKDFYENKAINLQNQVEKQKNQLKLMENKAFENLKKQQDLTEKYKKELNNTIKYYENIINGRIPENF